MASNSVWYAGRRVKRAAHDKVAYLEVIAHLVDDKWVLLDNPQRMFGRVALVEMRGVDIRIAKEGDWVAFTVKNKQRSDKFWQVAAHRRLYPYIDFSVLGDPKRAQHRLAGEGFETEYQSGPWTVRSSESQVLQVELRQADGVARLAGANDKVYAFSFDSNSLVQMSVGEEKVEFYDLLPGCQPVAVYDWSSDGEFALRIARSIADLCDPRAKEAVAWLEEHSKKAHRVGPLDGSDLVAMNDALRSGKLAKQLASDQALLDELVRALIVDDGVADLIGSCTERIAEQERERIRTQIETKFDAEMKSMREQRLLLLEDELAAKAAEQRTWHEAQYELQRHELSESIQTWRERAETEAETAVGAKKQELDMLVSNLEQRRRDLEVQLLKLQADTDDMVARDVSQRAAMEELQVGLDALLREKNQVAYELNENAERLATSRQVWPHPVPPREPGSMLQLAEVGSMLQKTPLLTEEGKKLMAQFLALVLAGEVPALCGPEVDDFLLIAESMFASGASARLEGDPTIITFEDLWLRPGTEARTALGHALLIARGVEAQPRTIFAVVVRAERSGARFWYPTLAERARSGDLPRRLLACITIRDEECEEAREILSCAVQLNVRDAIAKTSVIALINGRAGGVVVELDPDEPNADLTKGVAAIVPFMSDLGVGRSMRAARVVCEAERCGPEVSTSALVQLFMGMRVEATNLSLQRSSIHA